MASGNVITPYLARITKLPATFVDEAVDIFVRVAERNGGTMMGRYKLTAEEKSRTVTTEGASVLMFGTPAGFWAWRETGAGRHTIRPARRQALAGALGHPIRGAVVHPGFAGKRRWTATVEQAESEINELANDLAARAAA